MPWIAATAVAEPVELIEDYFPADDTLAGERWHRIGLPVTPEVIYRYLDTLTEGEPELSLTIRRTITLVASLLEEVGSLERVAPVTYLDLDQFWETNAVLALSLTAGSGGGGGSPMTGAKTLADRRHFYT